MDQILSYFPNTKDENENFEVAFCAGFFSQVAKASDDGNKTLFGEVEYRMHPLDMLF